MAIRQMTPSYSHYRIMPMYTYMATDGMLTQCRNCKHAFQHTGTGRFIKEVTPDDALINAGEYFNGRFYAFTSTWYSEPRQFLVMDTLTWTPIKSAKTEDFMQDMAYDYASKECMEYASTEEKVNW